MPSLVGHADRGQDELVGQELEPLGRLKTGGRVPDAGVVVGDVLGEAGAAVAAGRVEKCGDAVEAPVEAAAGRDALPRGRGWLGIDAQPGAGPGLEAEVQDAPRLRDGGPAGEVGGQQQPGQHGAGPHSWRAWPSRQEFLPLLGDARAVEEGQQLADLGVLDQRDLAGPDAGPQRSCGRLVCGRAGHHRRCPCSSRMTSSRGSEGAQPW